MAVIYLRNEADPIVACPSPPLSWLSDLPLAPDNQNNHTNDDEEKDWPVLPDVDGELMFTCDDTDEWPILPNFDCIEFAPTPAGPRDALADPLLQQCGESKHHLPGHNAVVNNARANHRAEHPTTARPKKRKKLLP